VRLRYGSDPAGGWRTFHPHVLFDASSGELHVDGVQVAGHSSQGRVQRPTWRQFTVATIAAVELLGTTFEADRQLNPASERYARVVAAVEP
jgi:hypothetical protein